MSVSNDPMVPQNQQTYQLNQPEVHSPASSTVVNSRDRKQVGSRVGNLQHVFTLATGEQTTTIMAQSNYVNVPSLVELDETEAERVSQAESHLESSGLEAVASSISSKQKDLKITSRSTCSHSKILVHCNTCKNTICQHGVKMKLCSACFGRFAYRCAHLETGVCASCSKSSKCQHGRSRYQCIDCGGAGVCCHGRLKYRCKFCRGSSICPHNRIRWNCEVCEHTGNCRHRILKMDCDRCRPKISESSTKSREASKSKMCTHNLLFSECKRCQPLTHTILPSSSASVVHARKPTLPSLRDMMVKMVDHPLLQRQSCIPSSFHYYQNRVLLSPVPSPSPSPDLNHQINQSRYHSYAINPKIECEESKSSFCISTAHQQVTPPIILPPIITDLHQPLDPSISVPNLSRYTHPSPKRFDFYSSAGNQDERIRERNEFKFRYY